MNDHASIDKVLTGHMASFIDDPLGFVLYAFSWGEGDLADSPGPDQWQADILRDLGTNCLTVEGALRFARASGHGIGKGALIAWIILWAMSTRPHLNGVCTAGTKDQLEKKTWRELAVWHKRSINQHWFLWTQTKFFHVGHPETWFVAAVVWNKERPEAFAGQHAKHVLVIYDEASQIPDVIWDTSEGAMTTPLAMWFAFGNPTRNTGRFRECFGRFKHRWDAKQIDSRGCRMANKAQIAQWVADYGEDHDFVRVRVKGEFPRAGTLQFIASDIVGAAAKRDVPSDGPLVMGVDVARFGDDQSVIRFRRGQDARTLKPLKFRGLDTMQLAARVAEQMQVHKPQAVFVDETGVGAGVVDRLHALGHASVFGINNASAADDKVDDMVCANKGAECWARMRTWLKTGAIDDDRDLKTDLEGREYGYDHNNAIRLEKKDDMKRRGLASPDDADALALTFAMPVGTADLSAIDPRTKPTKFRMGSGGGSWMGR